MNIWRNHQFSNQFSDAHHLNIDDIVQGLLKLVKKNPKSVIPFKIYNIGNGKPKKLLDYIREIEKNLNKTAKIKNLSLQKGDVIKTHADINLISKDTNYKSHIKIKEGVKKFIEWYKEYYYEWASVYRSFPW